MKIFNDSLKDYYANVYNPYEPKPFEVDQWDEKLEEVDRSPYDWSRTLFDEWRYAYEYFHWIADNHTDGIRNDPWIIGYSLGKLLGNSFSLIEVPHVQDSDRQRWDKLCETFPNLRRQPSPTIVVSATIDNN